MMDFQREKPEWVKSCDHFDKQAEGYFCLLSNGKRYYVPVTKELKKLLGISRTGDKVEFKRKGDRRRFEDVLRMLVGALYLQVRDTVGVEISSDLTGQLSEFIQSKVEPSFRAMIDNQMEQKMLEAENEG